MEKPFYPIKLYLKNKVIALTLLLGITLNLGTWGWLLWNIHAQEDLIFLRYNVLFGVDLIGEWWKIIYLPITGLCIIFINAVLGWILYSRDSYVAILLHVAAVLCQVFILIAALILVFLNV